MIRGHTYTWLRWLGGEGKSAFLSRFVTVFLSHFPMLYLSAWNAFNAKLQTVKRKLNRELKHMCHECKNDVYACCTRVCASVRFCGPKVLLANKNNKTNKHRGKILPTMPRKCPLASSIRWILKHYTLQHLNEVAGKYQTVSNLFDEMQLYSLPKYLNFKFRCIWETKIHKYVYLIKYSKTFYLIKSWHLA